MRVGMHGFRGRGGPKQLGRLGKAFLLRLLGKSQILPVGLRFTRKRFHQELFGFRHVVLLFIGIMDY